MRDTWTQRDCPLQAFNQGDEGRPGRTNAYENSRPSQETERRIDSNGLFLDLGMYEDHRYYLQRAYFSVICCHSCEALSCTTVVLETSEVEGLDG